ncbi:MAG: VOC family protein [Flavobacteriales bacterium]|nr:VOC family protein [Flavobacteriales bacterium]PCH88895.1 MAG: lactoylglutathione lyase [Flavobacteriales bacterium]
MKLYMEHINLSAHDLDGATKFFKTAFPNFQVRGGGDGTFGKWLHIGTDETYIAITQADPGKRGERYASSGINHVGFVVDDVDALAKRLSKAGYQRSYPKQEQQFRIRDYFLDSEGNEYEFVEYLSDKVEERNTYAD